MISLVDSIKMTVRLMVILTTPPRKAAAPIKAKVPEYICMWKLLQLHTLKQHFSFVPKDYDKKNVLNTCVLFQKVPLVVIKTLDTIHMNKSYILRILATRRPSEAPQRRDGTNRPLGTDTPYVQQLRKKYSTKNSERVTGLKVAVNKTRQCREKDRQRGLENREVYSNINLISTEHYFIEVRAGCLITFWILTIM